MFPLIERTLRCLILLWCSLAAVRPCIAGTWTPLAAQAPGGAGLMLLLTDGTVMAQNGGGSGWYKLTPDIHGSYVNGTWTTLASMHDTRLYYSSDVLQNGNVFVAGGEYGTGGSNAEVYNPMTNAWTPAPSSGQGFVDSISETLPNGNVLIAPVSPSTSGGTIIYNVATNNWTAGPKLYRGGDADEQGWVKLADGSILTIDSNSTSERYIPSLNQWVNDATVPDALFDGLGEIGAGLLLASGKVIYLGATGHTAIYTPSGTSGPGSWVAGPDIPNAQGTDDAPAAMMVNGVVLCAVGPAGTYNSPTTFYEYDPVANAFTLVNGPTGATFNQVPYACSMLDLPDGSVLFSSGSAQLYTYVPTGTALAAGVPSITSVSPNADGSYTLTGTLLNGISEGAAYGDDRQMASNYPIIRLTSGTNVYYARTYAWSNTGVMTGSTVETTNFTLPLGLPAGSYSLVTVANGIPSAPVLFTTPSVPTDAAPTIAAPAAATPTAVTGTTTALSVLGADDGGEANLTYTWTLTAAPAGIATPSLSINGTSTAKNATATFYHTGAYTFKVVIADANGLSVTGSVSVTVSQTLTSAGISPALANLTSGQTQQLTATAYDQFAVAMTSQPVFTWTLTSGNGTLSSSGLYTTPSSGTQDFITATTSAISATATMDVVSAPWVSADIGSPTDEGSAFNGSGTFTVTGEGSDIWGTSDQFHYVYRPLAGNGVIIARVATQQNTNAWAKSGVMIRDGIAANADHAFMAITPGNGAAFLYRSTVAGSSTNANTTGFVAPYWVKLVRNGSTITGYRSANGTTWTQQGTASIMMGSTVFIGLAVCSHNGGALGTSTFDNVSVFSTVNDSLTVNPGASGTINVLANDSAPAGTTLTVTSVTQGMKGSAVNNGDGTVTYTSNAGAIGTDAFTYSVSDGMGDNASATVNVVINGLQAYYKFEEGTGSTSSDATGDGYTATLTGTAWTTGVEGSNGIAFAGASSSYATIPALNLNTNTATITGWVRRNGTQSTSTGIVFCRAGTTVSGLTFRSSNQLGYNWNNTPATYNWSSGLTVPNAQWTFVALVITPTNGTLYMQPQGAAMQTAVNNLANVPDAFDGVTTLGQDPNGNVRYFNGVMDEVRIYNTALSPSAISALANASPAIAASAAATPATVTGTSTALSVLGASNIFAESALAYAWTASVLPPGAGAPTFSATGTNAAKNCTATFTQPGSYTLTATISDIGGGTIASSINVTVAQTLTSVNVVGGTPVIGPLITQQFTATALDQFGNALPSQPTFSWASAGYGSISSTGLYTSPYASGTANVTATTGGVTSASASVTAVTPWNAWLASVFSAAQAANPAVSGPTANPGSDGLNNLLNYAFNGNPLTANPGILPVAGVVGNTATLTYRQNEAATDVAYSIEQTSDFITWVTLTPNTNVLSDDGSTRVIRASIPLSTGTPLTLRLRVTLQ